MRRIVISLSSNPLCKSTSTILAPSARNFNIHVAQQQEQAAPSGSSDRKPIVTIFGGSGFVGKHLISKLAPHCAQIKVGSAHADAFNRYLSQQQCFDILSVFFLRFFFCKSFLQMVMLFVQHK